MNSETITLTHDSLTELLGRKRANNPKLHADQAIEESVLRAGFITPVVVNDADGQLLEGHGRLDVLRALRERGAEPPPGISLSSSGDWLVPAVHGPQLDPADALAFVVAANRTVELGGWDDRRLAQILIDLNAAESGLLGVGYDAEDLDRIVTGLLKDVDRRQVDPDAVPAESDPVTVRVGEFYRLGHHIVICGDSRDPAVLGAALHGRKAAALVTDPPYGVSYQGKGAGNLTITGDDAAGLPQLLEAAFASVDGVLAEGSSSYIFHPAGKLSITFAQAVVDVGWTYRQSLVWNKGTPVLGRSDYHYAHEPIIYASKPWAAGKGRCPWYGGRDQSSVFDVPKPRASRDHPTMKPVALLEMLLKNSTERGDIVLDPFLGSGSLLIAAERLGRQCIGVEIDPRYAQVAIRRWEAFTGQNALLLEEGQL